MYYDQYRIGGTSLASPLFAGLTALALQNHGEYGLANPALYSTRTTSKDITKAGLTGQQSGDLRVDFANTVDDSDGYLQRPALRLGPEPDHPRPGRLRRHHRCRLAERVCVAGGGQRVRRLTGTSSTTD